MIKAEFLSAVEKSKTLGIPLSVKTEEALAELEKPHYTVTLTGEFQVGKSTLLNKAFLGSDVLLTEGVGLATTAIPSKIVYAPQKELTVVYCDPARKPERYFGDAVTSDLLRSLTTAKGEDARLALSREIRHVVLGIPAEPLRTYSFFDTPGVNDPNTELIERTTAETLPESDIVLFIVDASKALTEDAKKYLSKAVFANGMSRVLVLASYKPQIYLSAESRKAIIDNIRADLSLIGRGYVPVISYTYDHEVDGEILHGPEEILGTVLDYLAKNRDASKIDKAAYQLAGDAVSYAESLKAKIEVSGKGEEEIAALNRKIETVARELDAQYNQTVNDFTSDFARIQSASVTRLHNALLDENDNQSALNVFMAQFEGITDARAVKKQIESAVAFTAPIVQAKMVEYATEFVDELRQSIQKISDKASNAASMVTISTDFAPSVNGGWAGKLNPTLLKWLEVGGVTLVLGPIYGVVTAFLDKIPVIQSFLPHTMLTTMIISSLKTSFKDSLTVAYQGQLRQMEDAAVSIKDAIKEIYSDIYHERVLPYQEAIQTGTKKVLSPEDILTTKDLIEKVNSFATSFTA